jgi:hypothetical protein
MTAEGAGDLARGRLTCPSSTCEPAHELFGIVGPDGLIAYLRPRFVVDAVFAAAARAEPMPPEARFRFAGPCREDRCSQWRNGRCGVIDLVASGEPAPGDMRMPRCGIRANCRWFVQLGALACSMCPIIVRDDPRMHEEASREPEA